ncbi:hypothetical protein MJO29_014624, partial [Puccinia striiformis f. sp. tritici]
CRFSVPERSTLGTSLHPRTNPPASMTVKTEEAKILYICRELLKIRMTPKEFITGFLTKKHILLRYRCRTWGTKHGWNSTINLARIIGNEFRRTNVGSARWAQFIQTEAHTLFSIFSLPAITILRAQSTPKGNYPSGSFQSARTVTRDFFDQSAIDAQNTRLISEDTPFLFNMIFGAISGAVEQDVEEEKDVIDPDIDEYLEQPETPEPDPDRPLLPLEALLKSINAEMTTEANKGISEVSRDGEALLNDSATNMMDPTDNTIATGYLSRNPNDVEKQSAAESEAASTNTTGYPSTNASVMANLSAAEAEELMYEGYVFTTFESSGNDKEHRARHLRSMFKSLRIDSGGKHYQQSHKTSLNMRALERFNQMANDKHILGHDNEDKTQSKPNGLKITRVPDTYIEGIRCLMAQVCGKANELGRFLMHLPFYNDEQNIQDCDSDVEMMSTHENRNNSSSTGIDSDGNRDPSDVEN